MMRIGETGVAGAFSAAELDALRGQFQGTSMARLPSFVAPGLLALTRKRLSAARLLPHAPLAHHNRDVAHEPLAHAVMNSRLNDPRLLEAVRRIVGNDSIAGFFGQFYRHKPGGEHFLDWHGDVDPDFPRLAAITITLNARPFEGGLFQLRRKGSPRLLAEAANTKGGDALLFGISPDLEHRNTDVTGAQPKLTFSGMFFGVPFAAVESR